MTGDDAQVIADIAVAGAEPNHLEVGGLQHIVVPAGATSHVIDLERYAGTPHRPRGEVTLWDAGSFTRYVLDQQTAGTTVYCDALGSTMTAVINGHVPLRATPGWGDHRAHLALRHTPQWKAWSAFCGAMHPQVEFAEFIEDHLAEIYEPDGNVMLELAQTFEATNGVNFKSSSILHSGERQLVYEEVVNASAANGSLTIPKQVTIGLTPYDGGVAYRLTARFRFRITGGALLLGFILDDPQKVLDNAFTDIRGIVESNLDPAIHVLSGKPAPSLHPGSSR